MNIERIEKDGKIFALLTMEDYETLLQSAEMLADVAAFREAKARNETALPAAVWDAIESGTGAGIVALRRYRGMTQKDLVAAASITQPYLSDIESGKKPGSAAALKRIAAAMGVTVDDLLASE